MLGYVQLVAKTWLEKLHSLVLVVKAKSVFLCNALLKVSQFNKFYHVHR